MLFYLAIWTQSLTLNTFPETDCMCISKRWTNPKSVDNLATQRAQSSWVFLPLISPSLNFLLAKLG